MKIFAIPAAAALSLTLLTGPALFAAERIFTPEGRVTDPGFFPIAVWMQGPHNAPKFKEAGINLFVGIWNGPTEEQLAALEKAGMPLICHQNDVGLAQKDNPLIAAWMHGDEPDNAQALPEGQEGWGPPIPPAEIISGYEKMRATEPSRPVLLNLGMGVAYDKWIGRGVRTNKPEDYPQYVQGADIVSFDIYPVVSDIPDLAGKLEYVPLGVERLVNWTEGKKPVWSCIEAAHITNANVKPTTAQVRAEVWMAIIRGATGLIYFVHQFEPEFSEASLLQDPELLAGVTAINAQVQELAPVLNSPTIADGAQLTPADAPIAAMVKRHGGATYLFAANLTNAPAQAQMALAEVPASATATELGAAASAALPVKEGRLDLEFEPYGIRLLKVQ